jgi:thymidylate synthase ThyX
MIKVLDHGYIKLVNNMGSDLDIVNSARTSFDKEVSSLEDKDLSLINFLVKHRHDSTLRHCVMTFEVYAPLMVARQWYKSVVASTHLDDQMGWNESCLPAWQELWSYGEKRYTVQDLLDGKNIPLRSLSSDGIIVPNRMKNIWSSGKQEIFTITDEFGNSVNLTKNHRVLTKNGWEEIKNLSKGDKIAHNGVPLYANEDWLTKMCQKHTSKEIADICGVTDRTIHEYKKKYGLSTNVSNGKLHTNKMWLKEMYLEKNHTLIELSSMSGASISTIRKWIAKFGLQKDHIANLIEWNKKNGVFIPSKEDGYERAKKAKETRFSKHGKSTYFSGTGWSYRKIAHSLGWKYCFYCENKINEIHHKDRDRENNNPENLVGLCYDHHYLIHGKRPMAFGFSKIASIESRGVHETYDIEMELEDNFVAGGIVVHNSRRYITENEVFYIPGTGEWRSTPENRKQGSGDAVSADIGAKYLQRLRASVDRGLMDYKQALEDGIAPEQARLLLPAYAMYVRWRWTASLNAILHFVSQRVDGHAQYEIQQYAKAIYGIVHQQYPNTTAAWNEYRT